MIKTTTDSLSGFTIVEYYGIIQHFQEYKKENIDAAFKKLELCAAELGANAIIGIRYEPYIKIEPISSGSYSAGRVIYGTAVKVNNT